MGDGVHLASVEVLDEAPVWARRMIAEQAFFLLPTTQSHRELSESTTPALARRWDQCAGSPGSRTRTRSAVTSSKSLWARTRLRWRWSPRPFPSRQRSAQRSGDGGSSGACTRPLRIT